MAAEIIPYVQSSLVHHLILGSLFYSLNVLGWVADKYVGVGMLVQMAIGLVYGPPLGNILHVDWVHTFQAIGDIGLMLLVFHGGLHTRLDLIKQNLLPCINITALGLLLPLALSLGAFSAFRFSVAQALAAGAALCTDSLGTTAAILSSGAISAGKDLRRTRIGTVLLGATMLADVVGLVIASVVEQVVSGDVKGDAEKLAWMVLRPIIASVAVAILTTVVVRWVLGPAYRALTARVSWVRSDAVQLAWLVTAVSAMATITYYTGSSMLFGAYIAGCVLSHLDASANDHDVTSPPASHTTNSFTRTYATRVEPLNQTLLVPLFFASVGAAVPIRALFRPTVLWKGFVYAALMFVGKFACGVCVAFWPAGQAVMKERDVECGKEKAKGPEEQDIEVAPASTDKRDIEVAGVGLPKSTTMQSTTPTLSPGVHKRPVAAALLLAFAMVSRGEIALLIAQIGREVLGEEGFLVVIWAVVLCTLVGPLGAGFVVRRWVEDITEGPWG